MHQAISSSESRTVTARYSITAKTLAAVITIIISMLRRTTRTTAGVAEDGHSLPSIQVSMARPLPDPSNPSISSKTAAALAIAHHNTQHTATTTKRTSTTMSHAYTKRHHGEQGAQHDHRNKPHDPDIQLLTGIRKHV